MRYVKAPKKVKPPKVKKPPAQPKKEKKPTSKDMNKIRTDLPDEGMLIPFEDYPEIDMDLIEKIAREQVRPMPHQLIYYMILGMKADGAIPE